MKNLCLAFCLLGTYTMSEAIILDTFDVPYSRSVTSGTYVDTMADPGFFGGHRDVQFEILENSGSGSLHVVIANGKLNIRTDPGVSGIVRFQYDGTGEPPENIGPGHTFVSYAIQGEHPLGDGTDTMKFYIDEAQFARGIGVSLDLYKDGTFENVITRNPSRGSSVLAIGPNPVIFAVNNAVGMGFDFVDGGDDIVVDHVEIVPEAGTLFGLAGAMGALGFFSRRSPK